MIEQAGRTESAPTARHLWGIGGLILLFGVLHLAWLLLKPADENLNRAIDNVAQFAGPMLALPLCLLGRQLPWRHRTAPGGMRSRRGPRADWAPLLLGMAILCETIGQIIWTYYEEVRKVASPFPSWADAVYLTLYPFLFLGIVLLPAEPVPGAARLRAALDGLMIMAVTATFSWFFLIEPNMAQQSHSSFTTIVAVAYPFSDLLLIASLLVLWARFRTSMFRPAMVLLSTALAIIVTTDSIYDYQVLRGSYRTGELLDIGWPVGFMLIGLAAWVLPGLGASAEHGTADTPEIEAGCEPAPAAEPRQGMWQALLPYVSIPILGALVVYALHTPSDTAGNLGVAIGGTAIVCLVVIRQILSITENRDLYIRLNAAYTTQGHGLARRVAELEWLRDVSRQVNAARTLKEVVEIAYDGVREGLLFDRVGVNLFNYAEGMYEDWIGTDTEGRKIWPENRRVHFGADSVIWRFPGVEAMIKGHEIYFTPDATAECPPELQYLYDGSPKHNLIVSLRAGDKVMGFISVDNLLSERPISPIDARPILALANQVALAVERRRTEDALRESEERLRAVLSRAPIVLFAIDAQGVFTLATGAFELLGIQPDALIGKSVRRIFETRPDLLAYYERALAGETHTATAAVRTMVLEIHWMPQEALDGSGSRAVNGVALDVTERAQAQAAAEQARQAAEDLARLRSDFVASVSHELRTPLTAIIGYAELLEAHWSSLGEAQRLERISRIVVAANRQQRLVQDLLLLSRMQLGELVPRLAPVNLRATIQRAVDEIESSYHQQQVHLDGPEDLQVLADQERTLQVLVNLLDNAAKYSSEGSAIALCWQPEGAMAVIRVHDRGPGIPVEGRDVLFTRFGRVPGSRTRAGRVGTGLGLYLGRQLAEAMGGDLDLERSGSDGSVFRLRLPLVQDLAARQIVIDLSPADHLSRRYYGEVPHE